MSRIGKIAGVTLIELLVVITIMMSMLGLVGGQVVSSVEKARAQTEVIMVFNIVKKASVKAFATGNRVVLDFSANQYELIVDDHLQSSRQFEFVTFTDQQIYIDRNGLPNSYHLDARVRGQFKNLDFAPFFSSFGFSEQVGSHADP